MKIFLIYGEKFAFKSPSKDIKFLSDLKRQFKSVIKKHISEYN